MIDVYNRSLEYGRVLFENTFPILYDIVARQQDEKLSSYHHSSEHHLLGDRKNFTKKDS